MNPEPSEVYVPTRLPDVTAGTADREAAGSGPVFTPGAQGRRGTLASRAREALRPGRDDAAARDVGGLFRSPEVAREVVDRLAREGREQACTAVAAAEPAGALVGAALAVDAGLPLFLVAAGPGEGGGPRGHFPGGRGEEGEGDPEPLGADDRVLLVGDVADSGEGLARAVDRVEATGARVAAVAVVVEVSGGGARDLLGDHKMLSILTM